MGTSGIAGCKALAGEDGPMGAAAPPGPENIKGRPKGPWTSARPFPFPSDPPR
jgi:hypothetical protein